MGVTKHMTPSYFMRGRGKARFRSFEENKHETRDEDQNKQGSSVKSELTSLSEFAYCWICSTRVNFS